jgi:cullin-associated NEDD8-dissociated protein 1
LDPTLTLAKSSLLQDHALEAVLDFFKQTVTSKAVEFDELLFLLRQRLDDKVSKQGVYNLAKSVAVITVVTAPANGSKLLDEILTLLEGSSIALESDKVAQIQFSLLITGDLGRMIDINVLDGAAARLKKIYLSFFDSSSEELKSAAAYALGNASVGSQDTFLPVIVSKLDEENKKQQYLLLSALREFIQCSSREAGGSSLNSSLAVIIPPLIKHCSAEEEGVRTMVAECMGSLTCVQPETMLPKLTELQTNHSNIFAPDGTVLDDDAGSKKNSLVCWTVATCVKLAIAGKVDPSQLSTVMPTFIQLLKLNELNVRSAALLMVYAAAKSMPKTIASLMQTEIMPPLHEVSELKLERKVDLGPFTHKVDDALPLRKTALSIFATCLENLPGSMDIVSFIPVLVKALSDAEDIQLHAYQVVISMVSHQPTYIVASIDAFVEPLDKTLNKKPGQKTGTELERLNDWIKSALRVVLALEKLEGATNSRVFAEFVARVKSNTKFQSMIESLQDEHH